jgi:hypothetical protein
VLPEEVPVFAVTCPDLDQEVLVFDQHVLARTPTRHGTVVEFHCPCGGEGVRLTDPGAASGKLVHHQHAHAQAA